MPYVPDATFPVNTTTAGAQEQPRVVYLSSGGFVIVWSDRSQSATQGTDLRGQAYDAAGTAVGDEFLIAGTVGDQTDAAVAELPGGGFIVAWSDSFSGQVRAQIFDPDGDKIGAEFLVSDAGRLSSTPDVVALESGNVVIVWKQQVPSTDPVTPGIVAQQFDATGARVGPLAGIEDYHGEFPRVTAMQGGGFVVSYTFNSPFEDYPSAVLSHVYDSDSLRVDAGGGSGSVSSPGSLQPDDHSVAGLENGGYVIAWAAMNDSSDTAPDMIFAQLFNAVGNRIGSPFEVNSTTAGLVEHQPAVVAVPGLGFAVAWRDAGQSGGVGAAVRVQFFTDGGVRIGDEFVADASLPGIEPHLAANENGELIVTWADQSGATLEIVARIFFPSEQAGGPGDDTYIVDNPNDRVIEAPGGGVDRIFTSVSYRLSENSEVEGLSTLDWNSTDPINLTGNGLNNYLIGNAGNNRLDGGGGDDIMYGREGNDIYFVDQAGDRAFESAGGGTDIVYTSVSYTLATTTDVENIATRNWVATDAINLTGNHLANYMIGNDGNNQMDGKAGADVMVGRAGNDKYLIDNAGDKVFETPGGGQDVVFTSVSVALTNDQEIEGLSSIDWNATYALNLTGNSLKNNLIGNAGVNVLDGKAGNDSLQGREGADTYAFTTALGATNVDLILGFSSADDTIALENNGVFTGLATGTLPGTAFRIGTAAQDTDDRILYDQATGRLFFDADGSGGGAAVHFATLQGAPVISANDFTVI